MKIGKLNVDIKQIVFFGVIAVAGIGAYQFYNMDVKKEAKDVAVDLAKAGGKKAMDYAKSKLGEKGGAVLSEGDTSPGQAPVAQDGVVRSNIKEVASEKFISIDNVSITTEQADQMVLNSVQANDFERVKYLLDSGVSVQFSEDKLCVTNPKDSPFGSEWRQMEIPRNTDDIKSQFSFIDPQRMLLTSCNKIALMKSLDNITNMFEISNSEWDYFYGEKFLQEEWARKKYDIAKSKGLKPENKTLDAIAEGAGQFKSDRDAFFVSKKAEVQEGYKTALKTVELLLEKTPKKDYYQFVHYISEPRLPLELRLKLADLYINNIDDIPVSQARASYLTLWETSAVQLLDEAPNYAKWQGMANAYKSPFFYHFTRTLLNAQKFGKTAVYEGDRISKNIESKRDKEPLFKNIVVPVFDLANLQSDKLDFEYKNSSIQDVGVYGSNQINIITNNHMFEHKGDSGRYLLAGHLFVNEMTVAKKLLATNKFNVNNQDAWGNTILHHIIGNGQKIAPPTDYSADRATAILVRYLLNQGINPTLMNKKNMTPHALIQNIRADYSRRYPTQTNKVFKEVQDAFTLKNYN